MVRSRSRIDGHFTKMQPQRPQLRVGLIGKSFEDLDDCGPGLCPNGLGQQFGPAGWWMVKGGGDVFGDLEAGHRHNAPYS